MKILSNRIRMEGCDISAQPTEKEISVFMNTCDLVAGYDCSIQFHPKWHHVVFLKLKSESDLSHCFMCVLPSKRWEDSINSDYEIVARFNDVILDCNKR